MAVQDRYPALSAHAETAWVQFAVDFKPQISAVTKLAAVAELVEGKIENALCQILDATHYLIRDLEGNSYYIFDPKRLYCHTLGVSPWLEDEEGPRMIMRESLRAMQIDSIKRAGLAISASCDLGMAHQEIRALMFGSFLMDEIEFQQIFGKPEDLQLTIYGSHKSLKSRSLLTPQTAKQASDGFINVPNVDLFIQHRHQPDVLVRFQERIARDSLFIESDFWREELSDGDLHQFALDALDGIELVLDGSIRKIKTLQPSRVKKHG